MLMVFSIAYAPMLHFRSVGIHMTHILQRLGLSNAYALLALPTFL